jgi:hypothetical protein
MAILFVSRVFAPAPGSAAQKCNAYLRIASPAPKPGGFGLRLRAKRKSLAALGSGYGLNEKPKTANANSLRQPGLRASPRFGSSEM